MHASAPAIARGPALAERKLGSEELPAIFAVLSGLLGARALVLAMGSSAGSTVTAYSPGSACEAEIALTMRLAGEAQDGGSLAARWHDGIGEDGKCLLVYLDELPGHGRAVLGLHFGVLSDAQRDLIEAYVRRRPFADGYFDLWQASRVRARRCAALEEALNRTDDGLVLLARDSHILFANEAAEAIFASGEGLKRVQDRLRATTLADSINLQLTLEHAIEAAAGDGGAKSGTHVVALQRETRPPLLLLIVPSETPPLLPGDVAAMIYVGDAKVDQGRNLLPVCQAYGLSPVEATLAGHLAAGRTLCTAAQSMRIKEHTARGYLKNIFCKTSTNRQAEVVALLLSSLVHVKQSVLKEAGYALGRKHHGCLS